MSFHAFEVKLLIPFFGSFIRTESISIYHLEIIAIKKIIIIIVIIPKYSSHSIIEYQIINSKSFDMHS